VVATSDGAIRALDLESGSEEWTGELRAAVSARQVPAASDPVVVADRLHLSALEPDGGEERWTFLLADLAPLPGGLRNTLTPASPALLGGAAVIGDTSGVLSAIDLGSGRRVWRRDLGTGPLGPVAAGDDLLYAVTLGDGALVTALEHNADGVLLDEPSPTTVFPIRGVLNFVLAAVGIGVVAFALSKLALRGTREAAP
jgi:outer membrane protein assembly factor BamB